MKINSIIDLVKDLDTSRQTKNLNKLLIRILLHLQVEFSYKVCYLYTHPNAPLNDLYQDVVLNLWKAYPKFRKECKISTWIYRIALNTCISFYRKEKNVPEIISLTKDIDRTIEAHDPINEMLKQLYQMINQLGQLDKSIILLYLEDKSYEEIAEITGLTVTNIATKLSRIKDKLKRMKKEE